MKPIPFLLSRYGEVAQARVSERHGGRFDISLDVGEVEIAAVRILPPTGDASILFYTDFRGGLVGLDRDGEQVPLPPVEQAPGRLVIIESPFAGEVEANTDYARAAMADSLARGEYPIASHLLYTQPGILDDGVAEQRQLGIEAGLAWRKVADRAVFYVDRGWSGGMTAARELYDRERFPYEVRQLAA